MRYATQQAQAIRKDSRLASIKSSAMSMLSNAAETSLDDMLGLVRDVFDNPDLVLSKEDQDTLQNLQKQGLPGIITLLEGLDAANNGIDFTA